MTRRHGIVGLLLFASLAGLYHLQTLPIRSERDPLSFLSESSGLQEELPSVFDVSLVDDSTPIVRQGESLVQDGDFTFTTNEIPEMLHWRLSTAEGEKEVRVLALDGHLEDWIESGRLKVDHEHYIVVPTTESGRYLNTFGVGGALTAAIPLAVAKLGIGEAISTPTVLANINQSLAAFCVALSAVFLFLTFTTFTSVAWSVLLTITYALGTCVYSISSQMLWQHGPVEMYLCAGLYFATRPEKAAWHAAFAGVSMAMATLSRPTMAIVAIATLLLVGGRRTRLVYILAGLPFAVFLLWYNSTYLGSPLKFGQTELARHALERTGSEEIWQTPLWLGAMGMLLSPSRGLLVFSPILGFGLWGAIKSWWTTEYHWLRPLSVAVAIIWAIEFRHFDWWSGWSYGYRHILDTTPILMLSMLPLLPVVASKWRWKILFGGALAWSLAVQFVGAFAYDVWGWNGRFRFDQIGPSNEILASTLDPRIAESWKRLDGARVEPVLMNIDLPEFRDRLWSLFDNPIDYYFTHFRESTARKSRQMQYGQRGRRHRLAETYVNLGDVLRDTGDIQGARDCYRRAVEADPWCESARLRYWEEEAADGNGAMVTQLFDRLASDRPDDRALTFQRVFLAVEQDRLPDAINMLDHSMSTHPSDTDRRMRVLSGWMRRRLSDGRVPDAVAVEERLRNLESITQRYREALQAWKMGDLEAAAEIFAEISVDYPALASPQTHLAAIRLAQRQYEKSAEHRRAAERLAQAAARIDQNRSATRPNVAVD